MARIEPNFLGEPFSEAATGVARIDVEALSSREKRGYYAPRQRIYPKDRKSVV